MTDHLLPAPQLLSVCWSFDLRYSYSDIASLCVTLIFFHLVCHNTCGIRALRDAFTITFAVCEHTVVGAQCSLRASFDRSSGVRLELPTLGFERRLPFHALGTLYRAQQLSDRQQSCSGVIRSNVPRRANMLNNPTAINASDKDLTTFSDDGRRDRLSTTKLVVWQFCVGGITSTISRRSRSRAGDGSM